MTQIAGLCGLGAVENLWGARWSGWFMAPGRRTSLPLLENAVGSTGNEVIQEGGMGFRRGRLSFTAVRANRDLIRGYDEASTEVTFTDEDGSTCTVLVDSAQADWVFDELWHVEVVLIQLTEPVGP
jgi:hypothetical protein